MNFDTYNKVRPYIKSIKHGRICIKIQIFCLPYNNFGLLALFFTFFYISFKNIKIWNKLHNYCNWFEKKRPYFKLYTLCFSLI